MSKRRAFFAFIVCLAGLFSISGVQANQVLNNGKPIRLLDALNQTIGERSVTFKTFSTSARTLRWANGYPEGSPYQCVAVNAAGILKTFPCSSLLAAACRDKDGQDTPGEAVKRASKATDWFGANRQCGRDNQYYTLIDNIDTADYPKIWPNYATMSASEKEDSNFVWLNIFRKDATSFVTNHAGGVYYWAYHEDKDYCALIENVAPQITPWKCDERRDLVCFDDITGKFLVKTDRKSKINSVYEAHLKCKTHGASFRLPTPEDLMRPGKLYPYGIFQEDLIDPSDWAMLANRGDENNPNAHVQIYYYLNYFRLVSDRGDGVDFWASRDLSSLPYVDEDAVLDGKLYKTPADGGADYALGDCLAMDGPAQCSEQKRFFCRKAFHVGAGGYAVSKNSGKWSDGLTACADLGDDYYFDAPRQDEDEALRKAGGTTSVWINVRYDLAVADAKRSLQSGVDRAQFLALGYLLSRQPARWSWSFLNFNSRLGSSRPLAEGETKEKKTGDVRNDGGGALNTTPKDAGKGSKKRPFGGITRSASAPVVSVADQAKKKAKAETKDLVIHWFDVGQGQLQVIEPFALNGAAYIIDAGAVGPDSPPEVADGDASDAGAVSDTVYLTESYRNGSNMSKSQIRAAVRRVIGAAPPIVILSHPDRDHINLLADILGKPTDSDYIQPARVYFGDALSKYRSDVKAIIQDVRSHETAGGKRVFGNTGEADWATARKPTGASLTQTAGDFSSTLTTITANNTRIGSSCSVKNAASLTAEISYSDVSVYFMGDAEKTAQVRTATYAATKPKPFPTHRNILTSSHHGAKSCDSNEASFAKALAPEMVIHPAGASGHNHPRCAAVQSYLSFVKPVSQHAFGCLAESPKSHLHFTRPDPWWDQEAFFYIHPTDAARNRHVGPHPRSNDQDDDDGGYVYEYPKDVYNAITLENAAEAGYHAVYTTQEVGHVKLTIRMKKSSPSAAPTPDGHRLRTYKSGPWVRPTTTALSTPTPTPTTSGAANMHVDGFDELRKRYAGMQPKKAPTIVSVVHLPGDSYAGRAADGKVYYRGYGAKDDDWTGPLEIAANGLYPVPLASGAVVYFDATDNSAALGQFKHLGQYFSNDPYISDDARDPGYGTLQDCAAKCLKTAGCGRFTFAYPDSGGRGNFCTLFREGATATASTGGYQMYERK